MIPKFAEKWTQPESLSINDYKILNEALEIYKSITYKPISVSKELAGACYHFKCKAFIPPSEVSWIAIVEVYIPLKGSPYITGITRT
ncbi:hypothetical protein ACXGQW_11275 [Wenyingzhuangia sp. IMCC45533]